MIKNSKAMLFRTAAVLMTLSLAAACTGGGDDDDDGSSPTPSATTTPTVTSNFPADNATNVVRNVSVTATFSEAMSASSLTTTTFTLTSGAAAAPVTGTVIYGDLTATFLPSVILASNGTFTATVTTGAQSAAGIFLAANASWDFATGTAVGPAMPVNLRTAGNYVILAKSAITSVPTSDIKGDLGISPAAATFITGFDPLAVHSSGVYATNAQVEGKIYAPGYMAPTPANLTVAVGDMMTAYTDAAGRAPDVTELGNGSIAGTLAPGVYKWSSALSIPGALTLSGSATDVWIFQIAQDLTVANGSIITLAGGALPKNVFWQVTGATNIGTTAEFKGVVLCATAITLDTGARIDGRLLAQTAVTVRVAKVYQPAL